MRKYPHSISRFKTSQNHVKDCIPTREPSTSDIRIFNAFKSPLNKNKSREDSKISDASPEQKGRK